METKMIIGFLAGLCITLALMPFLIHTLHRIHFGQVEREEGLASHKSKTGTPTMGGIVFIVVPLIVCMFVCPSMYTDAKMLLVIFAYVGYGLIGFIDDFIIVVKKNNEGLKPKIKFMLQVLIAILFYLFYSRFVETYVWIPILDVELELGIFYFFFVLIMFAGESNAVNLTDGLDGLCAGTVFIALIAFLLFAFWDENVLLAVFIATVMGSLLGYLFYNKHPAQVFMGDTGALALGGLLAAVAMVEKKELLLIVVGGLFLIETLSVIIQVSYYKKTHKRVFKMAPIHHHFELCGMKETQVVWMFYGIGAVLCIIGIWLGA